MQQELFIFHYKTQRNHMKRIRERFMANLARRLSMNHKMYRMKEIQMLTYAGRFMENVRPSHNQTTRHPRARGQGAQHASRWLTAIESGSRPFNMELFRMDFGTFQHLCGRLKNELKTPASLTVKMKVAIATYMLGNAVNYRAAGVKFGVSSSTAQNCLKSFCTAMVKVCLTDVISFPKTDDEVADIVAGFETLACVPQVLGVVDSLHIPIDLPFTDPSSYVNSKSWNSIVLQAVVDSKGRFIDFNCKHPGQTNDETVLLDSCLYKVMEQREWAPKEINGKNVHPFLLADSAYPLLPWLITPYTEAPLLPDEVSFNVYAAKARGAASNAFDRLCGRWKILQQTTHIDVSFVPVVVATCCILHNIIERRNVPYNEAWSESTDATFVKPVQPESVSEVAHPGGTQLRNDLSGHMLNNFPLIALDDE
ncbi:uncharacterized protein LOC128267167 [Anopheles cruzii]|uniref:uncharacterized protein LOC128267167 n=1 Tax=Anopheles cruzii TaxID=68878 RepID=UPI0022EC7985|nr:uncharacterized protein LOC128267167 [Anopheles cruzii]